MFRIKKDEYFLKIWSSYFGCVYINICVQIYVCINAKIYSFEFCIHCLFIYIIQSKL